MPVQTRKVYMNPAQQLIYNICARDTRIIAARRFGKTDGVLAPYMARTTQSMPRGSGIWLGNSRKQLLTRTVPATLAALERFAGWREGIHYWWGQPPKKLNIPRPIIKPKDWSNVISIYNGFLWHLVSLEVRGSANSLTVNALVGDESRFLRKEKIDAEVMPTLSGINDPNHHPGFNESNPLYKSTWFVSDAALTQSESWMEKDKDKETIGVITEIKKMLSDLRIEPRLIQLPKFVNRLQELRCKAFYVGRFSTLENIDLLGESYIKKMKRDLPPIVFAISILNMPKRQSSDGFYSNFDAENIHGYIAEPPLSLEHTIRKRIASTVLGGQAINTDYETPDFDSLQQTKDCSLDGDVKPFLTLEIAFDYNANINWVVTGQEYEFDGRDCLMTLSSMFTKNDRKLRELCKDWCRYYAPHQKTNRNVNYYYDSTAKQGSYAVENVYVFWQVVTEELQKAGWIVNGIDMGRPMEHRLKHMYINDAFTGKQAPFPRFNQENNEFLIVAMENTGVRTGSRGFEKDKSREKKIETEFDPLELRTDGTDAWDNLFLGVKFFKSGLMSVGFPLRG